MEIELKLTLNPADAAPLLVHPLLLHYQTELPRTKRLESTYFDTPGQLLRRSGCALRVRLAGGHLVQTLKGGGSAENGLHTREEWETPVPTPHPDLDLLRAQMPPGPLRSVLDRLEPDDLEPAFTTDFERTAWQLRSVNGDEVELALDAGTIACGLVHEPLCEVELELKRGDPACLFELADRLGADVRLTPCDESKAQRGYALFASRAAVSASRADRAAVSTGLTK